MKIEINHMYHGAALIQVAEDKRFTAINHLESDKQVQQNAYKVNDKIGLYLKYSRQKTKAHNENQFTFNTDHLRSLASIHTVTSNLYIALVCVSDKEICCLSYTTLQDMIKKRQEARGSEEDQYTILVTAPKGKSLRAYMNKPNVKNTILGKPRIVSRNAFPAKIFD